MIPGIDSQFKGRQRRATARSWAIVVCGLGSIVAYAATSATINGEPSLRYFQGWIAVLQSVDEPPDHQVKLDVVASVPGAPGDHPELTYTLAVCGDRPFKGMLILGGDARLTNIRTIHSLQGTVGTSPDAPQLSAIEELTDVTLLDVSSNETIDLGPVQVVPLASTRAARCFSPYSSDHPPGFFMGDAQIITGLAMAPVQRQFRLGWWIGPRSSQVWPLVGAIPGVSLNDLGVFNGVRGLQGQWMRPPQQYVHVDVGSLTARVLIDQVRPPPTSATGLVWDVTKPVQPTALLTNVDVMSGWQQGLVAAAIGLGIGGSLLASLLFELGRPSARLNPVALVAAPSAEPGTQRVQRGRHLWFSTLMLIAVSVLLLARRGSRKR